jgi:hypothetical protein
VDKRSDDGVGTALQSLKADLEAQRKRLQEEIGDPSLLGAAIRVIEQGNRALVQLSRLLENQTTPVPTKRRPQALPKLGEDRRAMVATFLSACNALLGTRKSPLPSKIIEKHIWKAAGHKWPRQFQYWKAGEDRQPRQTRGATRTDDVNFRRILAMRPADFLRVLKQKDIA